MTFSQKDFDAQSQELEKLQEELSRLDSQFSTHLKALGITEKDLNVELSSDVSQEVRQLMSEAQNKAKREGAARAAQSTSTQSTTQKSPGAGRRGAIRL